MSRATSSQHLQAWKWASLVFSSFEYPHQEVNLANSRRLGNVRECSCSGSVTAGGTSTTSRGRGRVDLSVCCHLHHVSRPADGESKLKKLGFFSHSGDSRGRPSETGEDRFTEAVCQVLLQSVREVGGQLLDSFGLF